MMCGVAGAVSARAAMPWRVVEAGRDGEMTDRVASVVSVSKGGVKVAEGERAVEGLVRLYRERAPIAGNGAGGGWIVLRDGQVLTGRPAPGGGGGEALAWLHPVLGRVVVPINALSRVVVGGSGDSRGDEAERSSAATKDDADTVLLLNGDIVRGIVSETSGEGLTVAPASGDPVVLEWAAIREVRLADLGALPSVAPGWEVELEDGSKFFAGSVELEEGSDALKVRMAIGPGAGGDSDVSVSVSAVSVLERVGGPAAEGFEGGWSLSLLPVKEVDRQAYLTVSRPARVDPRPAVTVGAKRYLRAITMTAQTRMMWQLPAGGSYSKLRLAVAMDPSAQGAQWAGTATLRVLADGKVVKTVERVQPVGPEGKPEVVVVELGSPAGAKTVSLEAGFGESNGVLARIVVLDAMLLP